MKRLSRGGLDGHDNPGLELTDAVNNQVCQLYSIFMVYQVFTFC